MKTSNCVVPGGVVSAAALLGVAAAQGAPESWPQVEMADLEQCRPVIAQVHKLERSYVRDVAMRECNAPARFYSTGSCRTARRWLAKTDSQDDVVWFFEGNDRCQGTDYPCFGVKIYNTPRNGAEARRWAKYFLDKSAKPYSVTRGMDLWTAAREADTCVSGVWTTKYRAATAEPEIPALPQFAESAAAPAPPPPLDVKQPLARTSDVADAAALAGAPAEPVAAAAATAIAGLGAQATAPDAHAETSALEEAPLVAAAAPPPPEATPAPTTTALKAEAPARGAGDPMQSVLSLIAAGKTSEALALGDQLAAGQPAGEGQLTACKIRVLAKQDLDRALVSCYSTGKSDASVFETRGQVHLLAGRYQDAWNDFNAAWSTNQSNAALYLRGLASAGMGNVADALRDMAKAEAGEAGIMAVNESRGYTLAGVVAGKPLVEAAALKAVPAVAPVPEVTESAEPAAVEAKTAPPAAPAQTSTAPAAAAAIAAGVAAASIPAPATVPPAPAPATPPADEIDSPATAPPPPVHPAPARPAAPPPALDQAIPVGNFSANTGAAVAVPGVSVPAVTDCLEPVAPGNGSRGAFKNTCNYPVRFTYCNIKPAGRSDAMICGSDTPFRVETIGGNGSQAVALGSSVAYFGCRSPTMPEVIYTSGNGLEGYCR